MKIITTDEQLRTFVPNVFASVGGEPTFYQKLEPFLLSAETWTAQHLTGSAALDEIALMPPEHIERHLLSVIIVSEAFRQAVPSLDLVLTPNGFGIVSNTNVVPASKERIARLIDTLEATRDDAISSVLPYLEKLDSWANTEQQERFKSTLFPLPSMIVKLGYTTKNWQSYLSVINQLSVVETEIAEQWLSPEYMQQLRSYGLNESAAPAPDRRILDGVRRAVLSAVKNSRLPVPLLDSLVNYIISHPEEYQVWHDSDTAKLFNPPVFVNKKESHGYFW